MLLNAVTSRVISLAITMKSQLDPKMILKHGMAVVTAAKDPASYTIQSIKYPNGVLQSNGHLETEKIISKIVHFVSSNREYRPHLTY